jgi:hypothetical protein
MAVIRLIKSLSFAGSYKETAIIKLRFAKISIVNVARAILKVKKAPAEKIDAFHSHMSGQGGCFF